jgi:hypothetical protein
VPSTRSFADRGALLQMQAVLDRLLVGYVGHAIAGCSAAGDTAPDMLVWLTRVAMPDRHWDKVHLLPS